MIPLSKIQPRWLALSLLLAVPIAVIAQNPPPAAPPAAAAEELTEEQFAQRVSYALGRSIADDCKMGGVELDMRALSAGVADVAAGEKSRWSEQELNGIMRHFASRIQQRIAADNKARGEAFLAENAKKPGVKTTASGLQYKVLNEGEGETPTLQDTVVCHYRGTFISGGVFDSSQEGQPATFPVGRVIDGWTEALQLMRVGAKYQLFVPSELAYKESGFSSIGPNETLIFEVELIDIVR